MCRGGQVLDEGGLIMEENIREEVGARLEAETFGAEAAVEEEEVATVDVGVAIEDEATAVRVLEVEEEEEVDIRVVAERPSLGEDLLRLELLNGRV
jgi:hypothetical protein